MILFKDITKLPPDDLAWLAAKLDSHGTFMPPRRSPNSPTVRVRHRDEDVIKRVGRLVGYDHYANVRGAGRRRIFEVTVRGARAVWLMRFIHPDLMSRQGQKVMAILSSMDLRPVPRGIKVQP